MRTNEYKKAIQQLDEYKGDSLPPCWLYSILINLIGATDANTGESLAPNGWSY